MELWIKLMLLYSCCFGASADFDGRWPRQMASSTGLCRYGARIDCCWGWARHSWGHCQPICQHGCKYGECVGPDKCRCLPGYTGKTCNQDDQQYVTPPVWDSHPPIFSPTEHQPPPTDLNECGLKPRPCKHRCMNTFGSFKCYCPNGHTLTPDGTCRNARTCATANCQYGCEVVKGEVRCQCPSPGLQLGPDGRTCVDVDECAVGTAVCPRFRKCSNTFGSYVCKCHEGFELRYINGKYHCVDIDECLSGRHRCGSFATCFNMPGSYRCKCAGGFGGLRRDCKPIPKVNIDPPRPGKMVPNTNTNTSNRIPDTDSKVISSTAKPLTTTKRSTVAKTTTPARRRPHVPTRTSSESTPNLPSPLPVPTHNPPVPSRQPPLPTAPPPIVTRPPPIVTRPPQILTHSPPILTRPPSVATPTRRFYPVSTRQPAVPVATTLNNKIQKDINQKHRGDVHIPRNNEWNQVFEFDVELGNTAEEPQDDSDAGVLSCTFDNGLCGWIRDRDGDVHWEMTEDPLGGKYLTIPEAPGKRSGRGARLVLPLTEPWNSGDVCLSFRHRLEGHHVGILQVFIRKGRQNGPAVWGRTGGQGWRSTQITLWGSGLDSVILKGERRRGKSGEMAVDDISLRTGPCSDEHTPGTR